MTNSLDFEENSPQEGTSTFQDFDQNPEGDLHLRFFVESETEYALPAMGIREVLSLSSDQITPVPNVSPFLLGILNLRGQVVWVADISQFLGDPKPLSIDRGELSIIVIETGDMMMGLAVACVKGMEWLSTDNLGTANNVPEAVSTFLKGEWRDQAHADAKPLRLLDPNAIIRSARWAA